VDYFKIDSKGKIVDCNIMTPTAQFLNNLEADLAAYLPNVLKLSEKERIRKIRALIRAYDPCISCATH
jgi:coenzyme F420-reducing hydrogenase alpha subunit